MQSEQLTNITVQHHEKLLDFTVGYGGLRERRTSSTGNWRGILKTFEGVQSWQENSVQATISIISCKAEMLQVAVSEIPNVVMDVAKPGLTGKK